MRAPVKITLSFLLVIGGLVAGFIFLLRGCLAKYDERSSFNTPLYFEKKGKSVLFSLVQFEKTTSYSQQGGSVRKSVSTSYYVQCNDAVTLQKVGDKKIKHHSDIRHYPVELLGASAGYAWLFMDELMAFDPFSLEQVAGPATIEEKNPSLKGKLPADRQYYVFNRETGSIHITAKDGTYWLLNPQTLTATQQDKKEEESDRQIALKDLTTYVQGLSSKSMDPRQLSHTRDSIRLLQQKLEQAIRAGEDIRRIKESLQRGSISFSEQKVNGDTTAGQWFGVYSRYELDKLYNRFSYSKVYDETARRQLFRAPYAVDKYDNYIIDKEQAVAAGTVFLLDGGFLVDPATGRPVWLDKEQSFLVVYKNEIGREGSIQLARMSQQGQLLWTVDTHLKEWKGWIITPTHMYVAGTDNKELSGSNYNALYAIDIATGKSVHYDFFTDK